MGPGADRNRTTQNLALALGRLPPAEITDARFNALRSELAQMDLGAFRDATEANLHQALSQKLRFQVLTQGSQRAEGPSPVQSGNGQPERKEPDHELSSSGSSDNLSSPPDVPNVDGEVVMASNRKSPEALLHNSPTQATLAKKARSPLEGPLPHRGVNYATTPSLGQSSGKPLCSLKRKANTADDRPQQRKAAKVAAQAISALFNSDKRQKPSGSRGRSGQTR
jgi:hypothetical protein